MSRISEVHALVSSLSRAERRHFSLISEALAGKRPSQQYRLFRILSAHPAYDPPGLMAEIKAAGLERNLPTLLPRLTQQILNSLLHLHDSATVDRYLYHALAEIRTLYARQLFPNARRVLRKAQALALRFSRLTLYLELLRCARQLRQEADPGNMIADLEALRAEELRVLDTLELQNALRHLQGRARQAGRKGLSPAREADRAEIDALWQEALFARAAVSEDFLCRMYSFDIQGIYHLIRNDFQAALDIYLQAAEMWEAEPHWIGDQPEFMLRTFNNFTLAMMRASHDLRPLERLSALLRDYDFKDEVLRFRIQRITYLREFVLYMNTGDFDKARALAPEIEAWAQRKEEHLSTSQWLTVSYNLLVFHFVDGQLPVANRILLRILGKPGKDVRADIREFARVFQIVLHYEFGNLSFCETLLRNNLRYFRGQKATHVTFRDLLGGIGRLLRSTPGADHEARLDAIQRLLEGGQAFPGREELLIWVRAKRTGLTFRAMFEARIAENEG